MKATEVTAGLAESNGSLLPGLWRDSFHVTCGLTACTPGSAPGPMLGNEYGKTLPFFTIVSCGSHCELHPHLCLFLLYACLKRKNELDVHSKTVSEASKQTHAQTDGQVENITPSIG